MSISSSALASLVIAGTAIGGSTFAVMANNTSSDTNSPSISQTIDSDPSTKLPGETTAPLDDAGNPTNITPVNPSPTPVPTPLPTTPVLPPFGGNGDDDDEDEDEDGNDDSYQGSDDDEDGGDDFGHDGYHGDDEDEEDEDEDEEEDD